MGEEPTFYHYSTSMYCNSHKLVGLYSFLHVCGHKVNIDFPVGRQTQQPPGKGQGDKAPTAVLQYVEVCKRLLYHLIIPKLEAWNRLYEEYGIRVQSTNSAIHLGVEFVKKPKST